MARRAPRPVYYALWVLPMILASCAPQVAGLSPVPGPPALQSHASTAKLYPIQVDEKMGYIDTNGKTVIEPKWDVAHGFHDGLAAVEMLKEGGLGYERTRSYIDETGKVVLANVLTPEIGDPHASEGLMPFEKGGKVGFIDRNGKVIIAPRFYCEAEKDDCGCSCEQGAVGSFEDGVTWAKVGHKEIVIDRAGREIAGGLNLGQYNALKSEGMVSFKKGDRFGFKNSEGKVVIEPKYEQVGEFHDGFAWVMLPGDPGEYLYLDTTGRPLGQHRFEFAYDFSEGLALAKLDDDYAIINSQGGIAKLPAGTEPRGTFRHGLLMASISTNRSEAGNNWTHSWSDTQAVFIDRAGKIVAKFEPSDSPKSKFGGRIEVPFDGHLAMIYTQDENRTQWVDRTGRVVWDSKLAK